MEVYSVPFSTQHAQGNIIRWAHCSGITQLDGCLKRQKSCTSIFKNVNLKTFIRPSKCYVTNHHPFCCDRSRKWLLLLLQAALIKPQNKTKKKRLRVLLQCCQVYCKIWCLPRPPRPLGVNLNCQKRLATKCSDFSRSLGGCWRWHRDILAAKHVPGP